MYKLVITADNAFELSEALHAVISMNHTGGHGFELLSRSKFVPRADWRSDRVARYNQYYNDLEAMVERDKSFEDIEQVLEAVNLMLDTDKE